MFKKFAVGSLNRLNDQKCQVKKFKVSGGPTDSFMNEIKMAENSSVVNLGQNSENKEFTGALCMPFLVLVSCVEVGSAAHK